MKNSDQISVGCVILAAGNSIRFGENKLFAPIDGKPMIERAFDAIPTEKLCDIVVITQYDRIEKLSLQHGFRCVVNPHPELGLSRSVYLGTKALFDRCDGILYQVADQPRLTKESVSKMLDCFLEHPDSIVAMSSGKRRGNPCIFPKAYFDELCSLSGDKGGRSVIERHEDALVLFEVDASELRDVDTPKDISEKE